MDDQLAQIRAARAQKFAQDRAKEQNSSQSPAASSTAAASAKPQLSTATHSSNLLQDVDVNVEFLVPSEARDARPSTRFSINPIFALKTALGQICSKAFIDLKRARLWKINKSAEDVILDLDKTATEAGIQSGDSLLVEAMTIDGRWHKISAAERIRAESPQSNNKLNHQVIQGIIGKMKSEQSHANQIRTAAGASYGQPRGLSASNEDDELQRALAMSKAQAVADEKKYEGVENRLISRGLRIVTMENDGNCLFAAVALQVFGTREDHATARAIAISHMTEQPEKFYPFISGEFDVYLATMSSNGEYGTHVEIQAMADVFQRPFEIFSDVQSQAEFTVVGEEWLGKDPIRLSYHRGNHYNAVIPI